MSTFADAQPFVTGACHFVIKPRDGEVTYLGTSEFSPYCEIDKSYVPLFNDLGGPVVPFDLCYVGSQAFVAADLTRFNMDAVTQALSDPGNFETSLQTALTEVDGDVGTLVDTEDMACEVFLVFPYQSIKTAYETMYKGLHFLCCVSPKVVFARLGTQPLKVHVSFQCIRKWDTASKQFLLADEDIEEATGAI